MTVDVKRALANQQIVDPSTGALTLDGLEVIERLVSAMVEQQGATAEHETRIAALEAFHP